MLVGVSTGFEKKLQLQGVGYKANVEKGKLNLALGLSHPVAMEIPEGLSVKVDANVNITVAGIDKYLVGQFSADVREKRKPEPYKGKGIRYVVRPPPPPPHPAPASFSRRASAGRGYRAQGGKAWKVKKSGGDAAREAAANRGAPSPRAVLCCDGERSVSSAATACSRCRPRAGGQSSVENGYGRSDRGSDGARAGAQNARDRLPPPGRPDARSSRPRMAHARRCRAAA